MGRAVLSAVAAASRRAVRELRFGEIEERHGALVRCRTGGGEVERPCEVADRFVMLTLRGGDLAVGAVRGEQREWLARRAGLAQCFGRRLMRAVEMAAQPAVARPADAPFRVPEGAIGPEGPAIVGVEPGASGGEVVGPSGSRSCTSDHASA